MTKKHFIALADAFRRSRTYVGDGPFLNNQSMRQWCADREAVATELMIANPRFNRNRWMDYIDGKCGPNGGKL